MECQENRDPKLQELSNLVICVLDSDQQVGNIRRDLLNYRLTLREELKNQTSQNNLEISDLKKMISNIKNELSQKKRTSKEKQQKIALALVKNNSLQKRNREIEVALRKLKVIRKKLTGHLEYMKQKSQQEIEELENLSYKVEARLKEMEETLKNLEKQVKEAKKAKMIQQKETVSRNKRTQEVQREVTQVEIQDKNMQLNLTKKRDEWNKINKCLKKKEKQYDEVNEEYKFVSQNASASQSKMNQLKKKKHELTNLKKKLTHQRVVLQDKLEEGEDTLSCLCATEKRIFKKKQNIMQTTDEIEKKIFNNKMFDVYCPQCDQALRGGPCMARSTTQTKCCTSIQSEIEDLILSKSGNSFCV